VYHNHVFKDITEGLPKLLAELEQHGEEVGSRAGRVRELTHVGITLTEPWRRELLVEARKPNLAAQIAETMWVLAGRSDIEFLSHYLPRAADFSDDGKTWRAGYGPRLRGWPPCEQSEPIDQLRTVFELLKRDPLSRQAVASIWDPALDYRASKDIPCNNWLSFSSRLGHLDLHVAIRSNDAIWGWSGINAFEWSALQEIMAALLGISVGGLHFSTTSFHLYDRHWAKADKIIGANEGPVDPAWDSPRFTVDERAADRYADRLDWFDQLVIDWFAIEQLIREGIPAHEEAVDNFPEPMLQSWLRVIQWWWTSEREYLARLEGCRLERAASYAVQPPERDTVELRADDRVVRHLRLAVEPTDDDHEPSDFLTQLCQLHLEKEAAYGGSWKKRGEMLGIMANIARKVDRLIGGETADETSADTAGDLFVYLAKYRTWLSDQGLGRLSALEDLAEHAKHANTYMEQVEEWMEGEYDRQEFNAAGLAATLTSDFDVLEQEVLAKRADRFELVDSMAKDAYLLARMLWDHEAALREDLGDDYRGADVD
jgi:thymidylate synthase